MDSKWTTAGKVLLLKTDIKAIGLNNAGTTAPASPANGEPWKDTTNNEFQIYSASDWLSTILGKAMKRTTDKTNGPYLNELIDSKNSIVDSTATTFLNISVPNKTLSALLLIEYIINIDTANTCRMGQVRVVLGREADDATDALFDEPMSEKATNTLQGHVYSVDNGTDKVYRHSGFTATISSSFSSPSTDPRGVAWDGSNIISADNDSTRIYQHSGFSTIISASFSSIATDPHGVAWDGSNVFVIETQTEIIYQHSGFTDTVTASFSSPGTSPSDISWDSTASDVISADDGTGKIFRHSGIGDTISDSFSSPSDAAFGVAWTGSDIVSSDGNSNKIYRHDGFTTTVKVSFAAPSVAPYGVGFYASEEAILNITFALGATSGGNSATQTIPVQVTIEASASGAGNIRYAARILSGGHQDAASGCEVTLTAA